MKVLIATAMAEEMEPFEKLFAPIEPLGSGFPDLKRAMGAKKHEVYLLITGIGKVNAASSVQAAICRLSPELVINCGTAGGLGSYKVLQVVLTSGFVQADVDLTAFGYLPGQLPGEPSNIYDCASPYRAEFERFLRKTGRDFALGLVATGDFFLNGEDKIKAIHEKFGKVAFDMESAAIAHVCRKNKVPLISVKCISDSGDDNSDEDFKAFLAKAALKPAEYIYEFLA